ncbi:MAG: hypothetical protein HY261_00065 [Chloroflexi bacterium]|nr:hypothetical protein [Chloroflexota bacterium]
MFVVGIFGGHKIGKSAWAPDKKISTLALFGGVYLDFRQAKIPPGGVSIRSCSLFGGTKLVAPKEVPVSVGGISIFGGKEVKRASLAAGQAAAADGLRISAYTLFGGFEVGDEG